MNLSRLSWLRSAAGVLALRRPLERLYVWTVATVWRVRPELLFNSEYYLANSADVAQSGIDPLFHFLRYGYLEGRSPHPLFDPGYYLSRYPDVRLSGQNPLIHYLRFGGAEGRQPHPAFDGAFYLKCHPDVAAARANPLVHFLRNGAEEGRLPHPDFDPEMYLLANPDVAAAGMNPVLHFARHGALECRSIGGPASQMLAPPESFLPVQSKRRGGANGDPVDVVIPVYKGERETRACIESVLSSANATRFSVIAINDCSPGSSLADYLRELSTAGKITLIENAKNLGFVQSVNAGMRKSNRDVVLLNSDTLVFDGWLDRLSACAYDDDRTGSVSPFSNNATICSYPEFCTDNALAPSFDLAALDKVFDEVNRGRSVLVPTTVGFCMYIRRKCLQETGFFDAEAFGKGYGEENDFCMRAAAKGWTHKLACDVFVYHAGSVSFGEASKRQQAAMRVLVARHPEYPQLVRRHVQSNPANAYRIAVTAHRIRTSGIRVFLSVVHPLGGGLVQHVQELASNTAGQVLWLTLKPQPPGREVLECEEKGYRFSVNLDPEFEFQHLLTIIRACGVERIHIHHLMGHTPALLRLVRELNLPFDFTVHDYYTICPQVTLSDERGMYCGEPGLGECEKCMADRIPAGGASDISTWRANHAWALTRADRVIAPSADCASRIVRYYPQARVIAAEHEDRRTSQLVVAKPLSSQNPLRVAVLGTMAIHKGLNLLTECAGQARTNDLPLEFILVGGVESGLLRGSQVFAETGPYRAADLPAILERLAPHMVWFPARWPETFSYTLSSCLELGLPVAAHDTGAFSERLSGRPWTWVVPREWSASEWIEFLIRIRRDHFLTDSGPSRPPARAGAIPGFYSSRYLAIERPTGVRPSSHRGRGTRPIVVAAAVASESSGQIQACGYVRVIQPLTHPLVADSVRLVLMEPNDLAQSEADVVLVQRTQVRDVELAERIIDSCRKRGTCLVFEIDDDLFDIPAQHPEHDRYALVARAAKMIASSADSVIASTETLRKKMLRYNAHSIVLPNYVDERLWKEPSAICSPADGVWRILYAGTSSHGPDLEFLGKAVRRLNSSIRKRIQIDVVGVSNGAGCDWYAGFPVPYQCASSYPAFVQWIQNRNRWHWGVAPLLDTEFNRSKSALKFIEYAALGLPALCSDMPVYREAVRSEETGLLVANDVPSWCEALERSATNPQLWAQLRGRCRSVVQENTIAAGAATIKSMWQSMAARREPIEREREAADEFKESGSGRRRD